MQEIKISQLSYLQDSKVNSAHLAALFCPQKAIVGVQFLAYFMINVFKRLKDFLWYITL